MILLLHYDKMLIVEYSHACVLTLFHPIGLNPDCVKNCISIKTCSKKTDKKRTQRLTGFRKKKTLHVKLAKRTPKPRREQMPLCAIVHTCALHSSFHLRLHSHLPAPSSYHRPLLPHHLSSSPLLSLSIIRSRIVVKCQDQSRLKSRGMCIVLNSRKLIAFFTLTHDFPFPSSYFDSGGRWRSSRTA